ncbi:hypothetical protein TNCV_3771341 [Trichonephila clavipes]|nr:hypothetical protein TNCV_3771341 [Trichonephila clavipes]
MAFLGKGKKQDMLQLAEELGINATLNMTVPSIKIAITNSEGYEEEFVKNLYETIIANGKDRKNEWLIGLEINTFQDLKDLMVVDQLKKKRANASMKDHFLDNWANLKSATQIAELFDNYEDVPKCSDYRVFERFGILVRHSSVYHPQSNPVERFHRTLKRLLRVLCLDAGSEWDKHLPSILLALRTVSHERYWQIPLSKTAQRYAAFCTSFGTYRPLRMSFGLKNAPYFFSKLMAELLNGLEDFVVPYLDDIAIFSDTWESHIKHMETVLQRIKRAKLTIKPSKCKFAQQNVKFLGHIVGQGFRTPSEIKVQAVLEFPTPRTKTQIRAFLGIAGYYQKYINLFSVIAAPLTDALKGRAKKGEIKWTTECENAFRELKGKLIDKPSCTRQILNENSLFKRTLRTQIRRPHVQLPMQRKPCLTPEESSDPTGR